MNLMTHLSETLAKGMDRVDGTAIADGRVIARDDVQDPHHQTSLRHSGQPGNSSGHVQARITGLA
jgi:hypothetical protein